MDRKGCWRKRHWSSLKYYPDIYQKELKKIAKTRGHRSEIRTRTSRLQRRSAKQSTVTFGDSHSCNSFCRMSVTVVCSPLFYRPTILRLMVTALRVVESQAFPITGFLNRLNACKGYKERSHNQLEHSPTNRPLYKTRRQICTYKLYSSSTLVQLQIV